VALVGNPNTGKTALFNALTGFRRRVANYPGVTVDVARGPIRSRSGDMELLDLPGAYSLAALSPDEMILCDSLCGRVRGHPQPSAILAVVDASNPMRNLYLVSQLLEIGLPLVVALNMIDIADSRGIHIDAQRLSERLGVPAVPVIAIQPKTVEPLVAALEAAIAGGPPPTPVALPEALRREAAWLCQAHGGQLHPAEALRILTDRDGHAERQFLARGGRPDLLEQARARWVAAGLDAAAAEVRARYAWIDRVLDQIVERRLPAGDTWSSRVDRVLTHRITGGLVLLLAVYGVFMAMYAGARPLMAFIEAAFGRVAELAAAVLPSGMLKSLVADGLVGGVGGVIAFLPQILILFLFIAILEDCGYLARAAFMVDRLMRPLGLSGRALVPLLSSFACAVPAIMSTRTITDRRERLITILIAPFMSCSARLPVYVLLTGALVPDRAWLGGWLRLDAIVMLSMYLVGVVFAVPIAVVLRRTMPAGSAPSFLLELPTYKLPRPRTVLQRMLLAGRTFLMRAGTVILMVNLVVWALAYFPRTAAMRQAVERRWMSHARSQSPGINAGAPDFDSELAAAYLRDSYLGRMGRWVEPAIKPLGWDWRIGVSVLASFPARELVVATLGTVSNLGREESEGSALLPDAIRQMRWQDTGKPLFTLPVALSVMVFFALCAQCSGTLVVMGRETGTWVWPTASLVGMTTLAYLAALASSLAARALGL
jgi:ferrous iron transport protein B